MLSSLLHSQAKQPSNRNHKDVERSIGASRVRLQEPEDFFGQAWQDGGGKIPGEGEGAGKGKATETSPLLPIFSAPQLDSIPVYTLIHTIRAEIIERVDTTLTWDQLRSPQVSQFLVKPILGNLEKPPVSKGLLYSLMANCLQFNNEAADNPDVASVYQTRAMLTELLALKLMREFSTLELIDCLSYDFNPMAGAPADVNENEMPIEGPSRLASRLRPAAITRISTLEIAVRAQAKKFLSHPLVIQHLDAIWSGQIVFHSEIERNWRQFGHMTWSRGNALKTPEKLTRRTATLYDAQEAGVLKLSRLKVPRYRHVTSTLSLGVLLVLYVFVLKGRHSEFKWLEAVFWAWSFGFMLDEMSGLSEKGLALHMISLWNAIDMLIYGLFLAFYIMRIISFIIHDPQNDLADLSYDVLASSAIFLFPRIFSVLDHYEYFSQLILGFKYMAVDLMAILLLIVIACSGFFVAFTLAFGRDIYTPGVVAYSLFQILMGFTPTAWDSWYKYDLIGKVLLTIFLFITHYLIFTLLVTVLTNSFAEIIKNAHEEHHFLVAANTLSLVKSENMFSYVAPFNLIGYALLPLRSILPFTYFLHLNRTIIQLVHFPILVAVFIYERTILVHNNFETAVSIRDQRAAKLGFRRRASIFERSRMVRKTDSMDSIQAELLEEVFRRRPVRIQSSKPDLGVSGQGAIPRSWANAHAAASTGASSPNMTTGVKNRLRPFQRFSSADGAKYGSVDRAFERPKFVRETSARSAKSQAASRAPSRTPSQARFRKRKTKDGASDADGDDERPNSGKPQDSGQDSDSASQSAYLAFHSGRHSPAHGSPFSRPPLGSPHRGSFTARDLASSFRQHPRPTSPRSPFQLQTAEDYISDSDVGPPQHPFAFQPVNLKQLNNQLSSSMGTHHGATATPHASALPNTLSHLTQHYSSAPNLAQLRHDAELAARTTLVHGAFSPSAYPASSLEMDLQSRAAEAQREAVLSSSFETQIHHANNGGRDELLGRMVLERIGHLERGFEDVREVLEDVRELSMRRSASGSRVRTEVGTETGTEVEETQNESA